MKKILIALGCLFLSACSIKQEHPHLYVQCWETEHYTTMYSGWNDGHGIGMGVAPNNIPFVTFKNELGQPITIVLTGRICAAAAE
jgi:hypothetical protein